ncbi:steroid receptor RNA activator 1 [Salarias fasciatus]|uniref:Steroid receptor RNA activator 1 n=1 Tax=Salarias fasciatus TaxID=181472 RepID=A0A672FHM3_SALFA|nr:steroid receptor RNA activator 1 [Salarias fasciatus]
MEELYVKPGNQERGWNDPPQFSYDLQRARGQPRNLLNKRAAPPTTAGAAPPTAPPSSNPLAPPPCGMAPRPNPAPPTGVTTPPHHPVAGQREADSSQSEGQPDVEAVVSVLKGALAACRHAVREQVCNDVDKRLRLLEDSWRAGKLSLPVQRRMDALALELQAGRWDSADELHRSLMVDHVTEVNQWMVGVKRLIAETRNLSPELLEAFRHQPEPQPADAAQDSADAAQDSADAAQDSADVAQDSEDPAQDSADPAQDSADAAQDSVSQS